MKEEPTEGIQLTQGLATIVPAPTQVANQVDSGGTDADGKALAVRQAQSGEPAAASGQPTADGPTSLGSATQLVPQPPDSTPGAYCGKVGLAQLAEVPVQHEPVGGPVIIAPLLSPSLEGTTGPGGKPELVDDATPEYWVKQINQAWGKTAQAYIQLGLVLCAAKSKLNHGEWLGIFKTKPAKFDVSFAQRSMRVSRNPALTNTANLPFLPPSPSALLALSKVPPEAIQSGIAEGRVRASMSIKDARQLARDQEPNHGDGSAQEPGPLAKEFRVVVWDDTDSTTSTIDRAPEKTYSSRSHPNLVLVRIYPPGIVHFDRKSRDGLAQIALLAALEEPSDLKQKETAMIKDQRGIPFCEKTCRYLTIAVRGNVPEPGVKPAQLIAGGYEGVLTMVGCMWPTALNVVRTARAERRPGWEVEPRKSSAVASSKASPVPVEITSPASKSEPASSPAGVALPLKPSSDASTPSGKPHSQREPGSTSVKDHLVRMGVELRLIAKDLRERWAGTSESKLFQATGILAQSVDLVDHILASFGTPEGDDHEDLASIGDLPFQHRIRAGGLPPNPFWHLTKTALALGRFLHPSSPEIARALTTIGANMNYMPSLRGK